MVTKVRKPLLDQQMMATMMRIGALMRNLYHLLRADQHTFNDLVIGIRLQASPQQYIDFLSQNRFIYARDSQKYRGSYTYSKTVLHTGELTMNFYNLNPSPCTIQLTFTSDTDKITTFGCNEGESDSSVWQLTDIPAAHAPADSVAFSRLFEGRQLVTYSSRIEIMPQGRFSRTQTSTNSTIFWKLYLLTKRPE